MKTTCELVVFDENKDIYGIEIGCMGTKKECETVSNCIKSLDNKFKLTKRGPFREFRREQEVNRIYHKYSPEKLSEMMEELNISRKELKETAPFVLFVKMGLVSKYTELHLSDGRNVIVEL